MASKGGAGRRNSSEHWGGQRGNKRGKERQLRRRENRLRNPRVKAALAEVEEHNRRLDILAAEGDVEAIREIAEHVHGTVLIGDWPRRYACCGRIYVEEQVDLATEGQPAVLTASQMSATETEMLASVTLRAPVMKVGDGPTPLEGDGNGAWSLGQARSMLMQGYLLDHVVRATGWGAKWFSDVPLEDGRGVSRKKWLDSL